MSVDAHAAAEEYVRNGGGTLDRDELERALKMFPIGDTEVGALLILADGLRPRKAAIAATTAHSWTPCSLVQLAAEPTAPPIVGGLLYRGERALLSGETESMKTWAALILAKAEMDIGLPAAWVDLDAMGSAALLERLQALGVSDETTDKLFLYYRPEERIAHALEEICATVPELGVRLFVIDAFNPMLSLHGLDIGSTSDVETFWREIATPISKAGAAPTLLDHVVKNADNRGK